MSQKSKTLLQLLQQQQHFHDDINTSLESNYRHSSEHTEKKFDLKLQKSIVDLYSQIKNNILKTEDQLLLCQIRKLVPLDKSEDLYTDPNSLICYIGCIFTVLMQDKLNLEQQVEEQKTRDQSDYEEQLIKLEAEIRQHIRIEQQLKLFAENTQSKLEDALKIKEELEEELLAIKGDFQVLYDKNNILNQKLKNQEKENLNLKTNNNDSNSQTIKLSQYTRNQSKKENIENEFPKQQAITINLPLEKQKLHLHDNYQDRLQTDPQDDYFQKRNDSQKRIASTHINNNNTTNHSKGSYLATRIQTESCEYQERKRKSNLSHYETSNANKHQRNKTAQNVLNLIKEQELKRQQSVKGCSEKTSQASTKPIKKTSTSQHTEANRSNNSVHSFRKQPPEVCQIPRPFSCAEQIEEAHNHHSFHKDMSMDFGGYQKQNGEIPDNQQQIKKLLQHYQQKHSLNDSLTKKLLNEYKKRSGFNCKTIY